MPHDQYYEVLESVLPEVQSLYDEHKARREHWYAHEYVPWEMGRNYIEEPWDESQCTLAPEVRTALVLNLLTEDNLPYYHSALEQFMPKGTVLEEWNRLWTAEENQHAIALRSYLLTSRNCDPRELEDDRLETMTKGFYTDAPNPVAVLVYTSAQELATRVSHRNAGKLADDEVAYNIMARVATDENHHFMFYRGVVAAMLEKAPDVVMQALHDELEGFRMPGVGIPHYLKRAVDMAKARVYNLRIHHDRVLKPLLRDWAIADLTGLSARGQELQEKIMAIPDRVMRRAQAFERRFGIAAS